MKINTSKQEDGDYGGGHQINNKAERRPPPCVHHEVGAVLPQVFDAVGYETDDDQPW